MENNLKFPAHNQADTFNISPARTKELHEEMRGVLRGFRQELTSSKGEGKGSDVISTEGILKGFTDLAKTDDELHYTIFQAGKKIQEAKHINEVINPLSGLASLLGSL